MQFSLLRIVSDGLDDPNCESIFSAIEDEDIFAGQTALILFPLEQLFDLCVFDRGDSLVVIEKPLDYVWHRIVIRCAVFVAAQDWRRVSADCSV